MTVIIDIGNSDVVVGVHRQDSWTHTWRIPSNQDMIGPEYELRMRHFFLENELKVSDVQGVAISSVVPGLTDTIADACLGLFGSKPFVLSPNVVKELPLKVQNPHEIGTDLVANAYAAYSRYKKAVIVVDFGTALTFTSVFSHGNIAGVAIAPGVRTAMKSLSSNTAKLPEIPLEIPQKAIGTDTVSAMQAGIMKGYAGLVSHMIQETRAELGGDAKVVATGGMSFIFQSLEETIDEVVPHLTLDGILGIGQTYGTL